MSNQRKQIIINEIAFWKQNKMLPSHYCDFLTSLYTGGDVEHAELMPDAKQSVIVKEKKSIKKKFILFPIAAVCLLVLLNFIPLDWVAITIGGVIGGALSIYGIRLAMKKHVAAPLLHVSGALLILWMSVKFSAAYYNGNNIALYIVLGINCLLWLGLGLWQKLIYFMLAGGLGLAVIIGYSLIFF